MRQIFYGIVIIFVSVQFALAETVKLVIAVGSNSVLAAEAKEIVNSANLAIANLNRNSGLKYKLELDVQDTQLDPKKTRQIVQNLKKNKERGSSYLIGTQLARELSEISDIVKNQEIVVISPAVRSDLAGLQGDYIFRTRHSQKQESEFFARYIISQIGRTELDSIILDSQAGATHIALFKPIYDNLGGKFGLFEDLYLDRPDYRSFLDRLKVRNSRAVYVLGMPVQVADLITEASFNGLKLRFFGTSDNHNQLIIERAGSDAEGLTIPYTFDYESNSKSAQFYSDYRMQFNQTPGYVAANTYDAVSILSACLEKVGDSPSAVKSCLYYIRNFDGAGGKFSIDRDGNCRREMFVKTIRNGKFIKN